MMPKGMYESHTALASAMWREGTLDTPLRELLRLKCAELAGCVRCARTRFVEAQEEGLTEEDIRQISNPAASTLSERDQTALFFEELLITSPQGITDELFDEMRRWFSDAQIVELCFFVLTYNMLQRFNAAIDLDPHGDGLVLGSIDGYRVIAAEA